MKHLFCVRLRSAAAACGLLLPQSAHAQYYNGDGSPYGFRAGPIGRFTLFAASGDQLNSLTGMELWRLNAPAGTPSLVKDIWPGADGSFPRDLTAWLGDSFFFTASDGAVGRELWKTDGTTTGTVRVSDIRNGPVGSHPLGLEAIGAKLFFSADDGVNGREPWVSDGTPAGTFLLKNIHDTDSSDPREFTPLPDGRVLFVATSPSLGTELWVTNGTQLGTTLFADLWTGSTLGVPNSSTPAELVPFGPRVLFAAADQDYGRELWSTDGSVTTRVSDLFAGAASSSPSQLVATVSHVFLSANDGSNGRELWASDGTQNGTRLVKNIRPGTAGARIAGLVPDFFHVWFRADDGTNGLELWRASPVTGGAFLVKDIHPSGSSIPRDITVLSAGQVVFSADDGSSASTPKEPMRQPWVSDGVPNGNGTFMLKAIRGTCRGSVPTQLYRGGLTLGSVVLFNADGGNTGREIWRTDGTTSGTVAVADLNTVTPRQTQYHVDRPAPAQLRVKLCDCQPTTPAGVFGALAPIAPGSIPLPPGFVGTLRIDPTTLFTIAAGVSGPGGDFTATVPIPTGFGFPATIASQGLGFVDVAVVAVSDSISIGWGGCPTQHPSGTGKVSVNAAHYNDQNGEFEISFEKDTNVAEELVYLGLIHLHHDPKLGTADPFVPELVTVWTGELKAGDVWSLAMTLPLKYGDRIQVRYYPTYPGSSKGGCILFQSYC